MNSKRLARQPGISDPQTRATDLLRDLYCGDRRSDIALPNCISSYSPGRMRQEVALLPIASGTLRDCLSLEDQLVWRSHLSRAANASLCQCPVWCESRGPRN